MFLFVFVRSCSGAAARVELEKGKLQSLIQRARVKFQPVMQFINKRTLTAHCRLLCEMYG